MIIKKTIFFCVALLSMNNTFAGQTESPMKTAIRTNDIDVIIKHVSDGANVNSRTPLGATALSRLCDDIVLIEEIIKTTTSPEKELFYKGAVITKPELVRRHREIISAIDLLLKKANPNLVLFYVKNPEPKKTIPVLFRYINNCAITINENKLNIDVRDENGNTPLHKAIEKFSSYNLQDGYSEEQYHDIQRARLLLQCGADINIKNKDGITVSDLLHNNKSWKNWLIYGNLKSRSKKKTIRTLQMPFYKEGRAPRFLVYPYENQESQKSFSEGNLCLRLRNREYGIKRRVGL